MRRVYVLSVLFFALTLTTTASAESVTVTSGSAGAYWDGSLSGFQLFGSGTQLTAEFHSGPAAQGFTPGTRANLNGSISLGPNTSNHTFQEQVNGTTYSSVWITAQLTFTTQPMLIPTAPEGSLKTFSTPFTATGQFSGYSDRELTHQVFSVSVQGSGVASSLTMRMISGSWVAVHAGAQTYGFTDSLPSPWTSADIGATGVTGISSYGGNGGFYVAGAGADIWGTADAFQFVSQALPADGSIIAHVNFQQETSTYAKAGVMIRQGTSASAPHVILDVRPNGFIEFMTRGSAGGSTTFVAGSLVSQPWLRLSRSGSSVTAAVSADGTSWTTLGTVSVSGAALIGLAVTSHDATILNQAAFDHVAVAASPSGGGGALPIGWSHADVGAVGIAGDATYSGGTFNVSGAGADIWGPADSFHFVYTPMNSDGSIETRVVSESNTNAFAKAGIMFRNSLDPGATHVILDVKPDGFVEFMTREATGGSTRYITGIQKSFPVSLKLLRNYATSSSVFVAYVQNSNGWQQIGWVQIPMGQSASAGLVVTSHNTSMLNTATFDTVHVQKNLLVEGGFEGYTPPALGPPGWVSDQPLRPVAAVTDTHPQGGRQNGACIQTTYQDCGLYQEVVAPETGSYGLTYFVTSDRGGSLVGINLNGHAETSQEIPVRSQGNYGPAPQTLHFFTTAGTTIRVWMYSPASPGFAAIDDVVLTRDIEE